MTSDIKKKGRSILLNLNTELSDKLTQAAKRSGRSKTKEATLRLTDHLDIYSDLATPGIRFTAQDIEKAE